MPKVLLSFPDEFLAKIDEYCREFNFERSEFIRQTLREKVFGYRVYKKQEVMSEEVKSQGGLTDEKGTPTKNQEQNQEQNLGHYKGEAVGEKDERWGEMTWEWCAASRTHHFRDQPLRKCVCVSSAVEDNPAMVDRKVWNKDWVCIPCLTYLERMIPETAYGVGFTIFNPREGEI